jgi:hypothetical protein
MDVRIPMTLFAQRCRYYGQLLILNAGGGYHADWAAKAESRPMVVSLSQWGNPLL